MQPEGLFLHNYTIDTKLQSLDKLSQLLALLIALARFGGTRSTCLFGKQNVVDIGHDAAIGYGDSPQQFAQLLIISDGQLYVARDYPRLLIVPGRVTGQLQYLGCQIFKNGREVDRGACSHPFSILAGLEKPSDSADGKLQPRLAAPRGGLLLGTACPSDRLSPPCHG